MKDNLGLIYDSETKISAYLLGGDIFYPNGMQNNNSPSFTYALSPAEFSTSLGLFLNYISQYLNLDKFLLAMGITKNELKSESEVVLNNKLSGFLFNKFLDWIKLYYLDYEKAKIEVEKFLELYLLDRKFLKQLTEVILNGSVSLKNLPIELQVVQNFNS